jgi:hypothetical protein
VVPSKQLAALIFSLEDADSPFERMHQLALAWRSIRELSRQERLELARHAGFDGAEELVERLAARSGGLAPALLLEAIESARKADPSKLRALFAGLRDPARRGQVLADTLRAAGQAAAGEFGLEEIEEETEEASEQGVAVESDAEPAEAPTMEGTTVAEPELQDRPPGAASEAIRTPATAPAAEDRTPVVVPAAPAHEPGEERQEAVVPGPETEAAGPDLVPESVDTEVGARVAAVELRPVSKPVAATLEPMQLVQAAGAHHLVARLLRVRSQAPRDRTGAEVERVLAGFPTGWPQRRALCALIESGVVGSASLALDLVSGLGAERDRVWCLGLVMRTWSLTDAEFQRALALVASPSTRRRLLRLGG